jgi:TolB-like protein
MLADTPEPHLSIGLAEEIAAALARFRWVFVVDTASLAAATAERGEAVAAAEVGVDLLLTGSVQRVGERVRISLRLNDLRPPTGIAWTGRFESDATDLFALQDEIAAEVVARIDLEILMIEAGRATSQGSVNPSAYDLLLRAISAIHRLDREGFLAAGEWLRAATALEPDFASAHAWRAYWGLLLLGQGWAIDSAAAAAQAERDARRAILLDPLDALGLTILGHVLAFLHQRPEAGLALHERALALNPNLAMAWVFSGLAESYLGHHEAALRRLDRYARLAPCHPHAFFFDAARSAPLLCLGRYAEAAEVARRAAALHDGLSYPQKILLTALGHLGLIEEARAVYARLRAIEPDYSISAALQRSPLRRAEDRARYAQGLRLTGLF